MVIDFFIYCLLFICLFYRLSPKMEATPIDVDKKIKEEPNTEPSTGKKRGRKSNVWIHFSKVEGGNASDPRCTCNYCGKSYACHSTRIGTTTLWNHINKQCKKYPGRAIDKKQKVLSFQSVGDGAGNFLATTYNKENCHKALARFVVKDEQPFNVVNGEGFKDFVGYRERLGNRNNDQ